MCDYVVDCIGCSSLPLSFVRSFTWLVAMLFANALSTVCICRCCFCFHALLCFLIVYLFILLIVFRTRSHFSSACMVCVYTIYTLYYTYAIWVLGGAYVMTKKGSHLVLLRLSTARQIAAYVRALFTARKSATVSKAASIGMQTCHSSRCCGCFGWFNVINEKNHTTMRNRFLSLLVWFSLERILNSFLFEKNSMPLKLSFLRTFCSTSGIWIFILIYEIILFSLKLVIVVLIIFNMHETVRN